MQRLELPESFDITAEGFVESARATDCRDELVVAGASVKKIDASGLQLLYATVAAAKARGAKVSWDAPSRTLVDAIRAAGLDRLVNL